MCWFSTEYANRIEDAKAGQRLGIKKMDWHSNWVVREIELDAPTPCPVCLIDRTRVLFRFSESEQASLRLSTEAEAVFRMLKEPKRDVFEFSDGRQITLDNLPDSLIFDVLVVPGAEQLSVLLDMEPAVQHEEEEREKEPFLVRLLTHFWRQFLLALIVRRTLLSSRSSKPRWDWEGADECNRIAAARWSRESMRRPTYD